MIRVRLSCGISLWAAICEPVIPTTLASTVWMTVMIFTLLISAFQQHDSCEVPFCAPSDNSRICTSEVLLALTFYILVSSEKKSLTQQENLAFYNCLLQLASPMEHWSLLRFGRLMLKLEADEGDKELIQTIETPALLDIINVTRK